MLEVLAVPQGDYLLQTAAGSVLGRQMIQVGCMGGGEGLIAWWDG